MKMPIMEEITCVSDVLNIVDPKTNLLKGLYYEKATYEKFPHGIWFRGQGNSEWQLTPKVFRTNNSGHIIHSEDNIYHQFQLRQPNYRYVYQSAFDWLCLMQHYGAPTRLLDWTESILVALYFAVDSSGKNKDVDAKLFALSAPLLNRYVPMGRYTIFTPENIAVGLRAEVATSRFVNTKDLLERVASIYNPDKSYIESFRRAMSEDLDSFWGHLSYPIAVYPFRLNDRMTFQESVFTVHGGSWVDGHQVPKEDKLPWPNSLEKLNEEKSSIGASFLKTFIIQQKYKESIEDELRRIGIHQGTLFPELDYQASYITRQWTINN